ncbi:MAG: hypothetical protein ACQEVA_14795 [Myxococcota bacterium]
MLKYICLPLLALTLTLGACMSDPDPDNNANNTDNGDAELDLDSTTEDGESCDVGECDAAFVPPITVHVKTADGGDYCGDGVSVRAWEEGSDPPTDWTMCECSETGRDGGAPTDTDGLVRDDFQCYVSAQPGETTVVEMKAMGYDALQQTVDVPCRCNPQTSVTFELPN